MRWTGRTAARNATPMSARNAVGGRQERHHGRRGSGTILMIVVVGVERVIGLSVGSGGCDCRGNQRSLSLASGQQNPKISNWNDHASASTIRPSCHN